MYISQDLNRITVKFQSFPINVCGVRVSDDVNIGGGEIATSVMAVRQYIYHINKRGLLILVLLLVDRVGKAKVHFIKFLL